MYDDNSGVPLCNSEIVEEHLVLRQRLLQTISSILRLRKRHLKKLPKTIGLICRQKPNDVDHSQMRLQ